MNIFFTQNISINKLFTTGILHTIHSFHMDVAYCLHLPLSLIDMLPYSYCLNYLTHHCIVCVNNMIISQL